MVRNKLGHFALGVGVAVVGIVGSQIDAVGTVGRVASMVVAGAGLFWALVMGHAPFVLAFVVGIPFSAATYIWRNPIRVQGGEPRYELGRVAAFSQEPDRILVVTLSAAGTHGHAIHRRPAILERARQSLVAANVPEVRQDDARLRAAVSRWNVNERLLDKLRARRRPSPSDDRPWIDLDDRSRSSVDRVFGVLDILRGCVDPSERDDAVLLALWYADACDEAYERRHRGHRDRILVEV